MKTMDLHMHSNFSDDAEMSPLELVLLGKEVGLTVMALTDHSRVTGVDEMLKHGKEHGITIIPAVELDCVYKGLNIHVLGYGIDHQDLRYAKYHQDLIDQEKKAGQIRIDKTEAFFKIKFTPEELETIRANSAVTGELLGSILLQREDLLDHPDLVAYRKGGMRSDNPHVNIYWDFYSQGKPCYSELHFMSIEAAIDLINTTGGLAVIAHPGISFKHDLSLLDGLLDVGIEGVEVYSSYHSPEQVKYFYDFALKNNLYMTLGSDFHGDHKPAIHLGIYEGDELQLSKTKAFLLSQ